MLAQFILCQSELALEKKKKSNRNKTKQWCKDTKNFNAASWTDKCLSSPHHSSFPVKGMPFCKPARCQCNECLLNTVQQAMGSVHHVITLRSKKLMCRNVTRAKCQTGFQVDPVPSGQLEACHLSPAGEDLSRSFRKAIQTIYLHVTSLSHKEIPSLPCNRFFF